MTNVIQEDEVEAFYLQSRLYCTDSTLPPPGTSEMALDKWWSFIQQTCKFDTLLKCVTAALSCFHGPSVESTFSVMSTILDSHSPVPPLHLHTVLYRQ